ncbi:helix-turn-helix transcriptional regulator [Roseibium marinum]|uniref:Regulatory LuxR family protein n=1 Tax=Roseibium marinum TaxID=281252 RepID=A0A2S3V3L5_9HYPH|nr:helix-turn-helix transcriptional regulator [Roseibium marinum]POF34259.1 regulatory LuxR family protein [Roseibium marinum]
MTSLNFPKNANERRAFTLAAIILLQALCAFFFVGDVFVDMTEGGHLDDIHMALEALAALALICGVIYLMLELRQLLRRFSSMATGLRAARGEMTQLIDSFFDSWDLTPSERDVALLVLKGFDNEDIARLRGTAAGTVRAQTAKIYSKANVEGRSHLFSIFMEELFSDHLGEGGKMAKAGGNV